MPCGTNAPAAINEHVPITAPFMMIAPIPISTWSSTSQPCTTALCPMLTPVPMFTGNSLSTCTVTPSWMLVPAPTWIGSASARSVAEYQTLARADNVT